MHRSQVILLFSGIVGALARTEPGSADGYSGGDQRHCLISPAEEIRLWDRSGDAHGLEKGPQREIYPQLSDAEFALLLQYWRDCDLLRQFYSNVQMSGRLTRYRAEFGGVITDDTKPESATFHYFSAGVQDYRLDMRWVDPVGKEYSIIAIISPDDQYLLQTDLKTNQLFLKGQAKNLNRAFCQFCAYSPHHVPFTDQDKWPTFIALFFPLLLPRGHITSVTPQMDEEGDEIVRIVWTHETGHTTKTFDLLHKQGWAIKRYRWGGARPPDDRYPNGHAFMYDFRCTYAPGPNHMPLLTSSLRQEWYADQDDLSALQLVKKEIIEVSEFNPQPAAKEVFDVNQLLGRRLKVASGRTESLWWGLVLNGFALFLIGAWLLKRRSYRPS